MKLKLDGSIQFESCKDIVEYIMLCSDIECDRDVSTLQEVVDSGDYITEPSVEVDGDTGEILVERGSLDDYSLEYDITSMQESASGLIGGFDDDGIILEVLVGGLRFQKSGKRGKWVCLSKKIVRGLPLGYSGEEFDEVLDSVDGGADDVYDLFSDALDLSVDIDEQFRPDYRMFRSVEDDEETIAHELEGLGYDGFYLSKVDGAVYGWCKGMPEPDEDFDESALVDAATAAKYCLDGVLPSEKTAEAAVVKEQKADEKMDMGIVGLPKFQLLLEFFWNLEGPYKVLELDEAGRTERLGRLSVLRELVAFDEYKPIVEEIVKTAKIHEVRRYQSGVEVVKYNVWRCSSSTKDWLGPYMIDVKYGPDGGLVSYTFDSDERTPFLVKAMLIDGDLTAETSRVEDILDFCWNMKSDTGLFLEERDEDAMVHVWNIGSEEVPAFLLEWLWGGYERMRMYCRVTSLKSMVDFVKRYISGGLGKAQYGLQWRPVYAEIKCPNSTEP